MCNRLASSLAAVAAISLSASLCWAGQETRLAAAGPVNDTAAPAKVAKKPAVAPKLEVAAELGVLDAQLKLARIYATGDGAKANLKKAFNLYQRIIEDHADVRPNYGRADGVAQAFVALGSYYRTGIPGVADVDKKRAARLLHYAASYYGDPEAQCDLAQMYLNGEGVQRHPLLAVNWLANAAKKRHARAQALLGDLLLRGAQGVPRQTRKGLALLSLARQNAAGEAQARWIEDIYSGAYSESDESEREEAANLVARWQPLMGRREGVPSAQTKPTGKTVSVTVESGKEAGNKAPASGFTNVGMESPAAVR